MSMKVKIVTAAFTFLLIFSAFFFINDAEDNLIKIDEKSIVYILPYKNAPIIGQRHMEIEYTIMYMEIFLKIRI